MEEDILHFEALDGGAVVVKDQAGGCVPDADLCAHLGVSIASSRQMVGMHDRSREWKRSVCSPNMSCNSISKPIGKDDLADILTVWIRGKVRPGVRQISNQNV